MASAIFPPCPPQLRAVQHYLKLASDYETRSPPICYWARLYALQSALKIDRKSVEAKKLLSALMDWLETFKKENPQNEAITIDVAGQAVLENEAHKLFTKADAEDRAANFTKNLVKMFYTCGIILDVCEIFGDLSNEVAVQRKYAKWKATYIHNCLKNGEIPIAGPLGGEENDDGMESEATGMDQRADYSQPSVPGASTTPYVPAPSSSPHIPTATINPNVPTEEYGYVPQETPSVETPSDPQVSPQQIAQAQKFCKYALSAMDYEDIGTAVGNLEKALASLRLH